jgi:uncharacterized protein YkwD
MKKLFLLALLLVGTVGCDEKPDPPSPPPPVVDNNNVKRVFELINQERVNAGLSPLKQNAILNVEADRYAGVMASRNQMSHELEGDFGQRIRRTGYNGRMYGENIAYNYQTPEAVVRGWMNSSGHRANILNRNFDETGVGIRLNSSGQPYYCQIFGRSR